MKAFLFKYNDKYIPCNRVIINKILDDVFFLLTPSL